MIGKPTTYHRTGMVVVALLTVLVILFGWVAVNHLIPGEKEHTALELPVEPTESAAKSFLVYRTYEVLDRGDQEWANDDTIAYQFERYALDGTATHERIASVTRSAIDSAPGQPWMKQVSSDALLFAKRDAEAPEDANWIDISGGILDVPDTDPDILWTGLPSKDRGMIAYADRTRSAVSVLTIRDGLTKSYGVGGLSDLGYLAPFAWHVDGVRVYLKPVFEGEGLVSGLWVLNTLNGNIKEIEIVNELGLSNFTVSIHSNTLVGSSFRCDGVDLCGIGPSTLYEVHLGTSEATEILHHQVLAYANPLISPDGKRTAYTFTSEAADIWVVENDQPDTNRRFISGHALAWTPDGRGLIVERDREIQIVDVLTGTITTVVKATGKYNDADFQGVDFIGIVEKR